MSGAPNALTMAVAGALAQQAEMAAMVGRPTGRQREPGPLAPHIAERLKAVKARIAGRSDDTPQSLPVRTWASMAPAVRTALVMLALDTPGEPRELARQSWDAFSDSDKAALAAIARTFNEETRNARCLW